MPQPQNNESKQLSQSEASKITLANMLSTDKPIALSLNREQAAILLKGLESLPDIEKKKITYIHLKRDLDSIVVIWDRRIKNETIIRAAQRARKLQGQPTNIPAADKPVEQRMRVEHDPQPAKEDDNVSVRSMNPAGPTNSTNPTNIIGGPIKPMSARPK